MGREGVLRGSSWGEMLPRWASVSAQVGDFARASRLVVVSSRATATWRAWRTSGAFLGASTFTTPNRRVVANSGVTRASRRT
eukprot:14399376-Alexandrium_andersonii.AAC.1